MDIADVRGTANGYDYLSRALTLLIVHLKLLHEHVHRLGLVARRIGL